MLKQKKKKKNRKLWKFSAETEAAKALLYKHCFGSNNTQGCANQGSEKSCQLLGANEQTNSTSDLNIAHSTDCG